MRFLIFIAIYLGVYGGMHLYFYRRLRRAFAFGRGGRIALILFLLLMLFGPLLVHSIEDRQWSAAAFSFALLVYCWMGALLMSVSGFLFVDIVRYLVRLGHYLAHRTLPSWDIPWRPVVLGVVSLSLVVTVYGYFAAREIHIERVTLATAKLPVGVERYRIVQLSDVHLGLMTDREWLERIVAEVNSLKPDLIVTTGDIIDSRVASALPYQTTLAQLQAHDGRYAVAGNHEFFAGIDNAAAYMGEAGFVMLRGEQAIVQSWLTLLGVDDREGRLMDGSGVDHEALLMAGIDVAHFNILLKHQPVVREASLGRFDLQLAGHVHQGQIFPFRLVTWLVYPVAMGLSELGSGSQLYVSRGTGTWGPPLRVMAPPEITLIELQRAS